MKKIPPELRPFVYIAFAFILFTFFYVTFSPYQQCMRLAEDTQRQCAYATSW